MAKIRVGIVGAGFGGTVHAPGFAIHPAFDVVAIASPNSAGAIAKERNIPHHFPTLAAMLEGVELDAVSIASPPFDHHAAVMLALERGKHVLCEKPFALNLAQAQEMVAASNNAGTACGVVHEYRFLPDRQAMKELIANRHLGALREIEVTYFAGILRPDGQRARSWWFERERGGGVAGAIFSHLIDSANWLAGRAPLRAHGFLRTANAQRTDSAGTFTSTVDDGAFALLDYGDGLVGRLTADATLRVESFTLAVHGEDRTAVASGKTMQETTLFTADDDETAELQCSELPHKVLAAANRNLPAFVALLDQFAAAIATGTSALPSFEEALDTQRVLETIGYSA